MRITVILFALIVSFAQPDDANQLIPVINNLSVIARLINGISVQSEFMRSSQNLNAVVGELLGIGDSIPELLKVKVKDLMKDVDGILKGVKALPTSSNQNLEAISDTVPFLKSIALEKLKKAANLDLTTSNSKWTSAGKTEPNCYFLPTSSDIVSSFKYIMETPLDFEKNGTKESLLKNFDIFQRRDYYIDSMFSFIRDHSPELNTLQDIVGTKSQIPDLLYTSRVLENYIEHLSPLLSLSQLFTNLNMTLASFDPVIKKIQTISTDSKSLGIIGNALLTDKIPDKSLTAGLPNGISDLKMLFDDLNGKRLKENVADGKDMKMMVTALEPLKKFYENLKPLETSWGKMREDPQTGRNVGNIASILKIGKAMKLEDILSQSVSAGKCFQNLKSVPGNFNLAKFEKFYSKLDALDKSIPIIKEAVEKLVTAPNFDKVHSFGMIRMRPLSRYNTNEEIAYEIEEVRNNADFQEMAKLIFEYVEAIKKVSVTDISDIIKLWQSVPDLHSTPTDTGLIVAIDCLNKMKFDYTAAEAFSSFGLGIQEVKTRNGAQKSMQMFGEAVGSLINADKKAKETVNGMKVSTRRRRRRGVEAKGFLKLADSGKFAQELGNGVQVLREMSEVFENQKKVLKVAKSDAAVDTVIQSIPEMAGKWTVDNKKALEKLVDEVNALNKAVDKDRSLKGVWKLFGAAQSVNGAPIEGRILGTSVFEILEKSTDANAKSAAPDFKNFPPLQLDFANQKRIILRETFTLLQPITSFFKDFFVMDTSSSTQPSDSSPNYLLFAGAGVGGLLLVAAVGAGGYFGLRKFQTWQMYRNPERWWIYNGFSESLFLAVSENSTEKANQLMEEGVFVNTFVNGRSILHEGVRIGSATLVEALITHGADRDALDENGRTPLQLLGDVPEASAIRTIFEKFSDKRFKNKIPNLMPKNKFKVFWLSMIEDRDKFEKRFGKQMCQSIHDDITHVVVDVDPSGVYRFDGAYQKAMEFLHLIVFSRVCVVSVEWAKNSLRRSLTGRGFYTDYDCRLKKLEFNGKIYTNLDKLKEFARGRRIKYGHGIQLSFLNKKNTSNDGLRKLFKDQGFTVFEKTAGKRRSVMKPDPKAKSFYRPDMNANFIVYEGESIKEFEKKLRKVNLKDYTVMSLDEFTVFMLEMKMTGGKSASQFPNETLTPTKTTSAKKTTVKSTQ